MRLRPRIFLSYSSHDTALVDELEHSLQLLQVDIWRDRNELLLGGDIEKSITKAINENTDVLMVCLTNNSLAAPWVKKESELAKSARYSGSPIDIVYVKLDNATYVPPHVAEKLYVDLSVRKSRTEAFLKLAGFLAGRSQFLRTGIYDIYHNYMDLFNRQENIDGGSPCSIDDIVSSAHQSVVGVGYWFRTFLGISSGLGVGNFLQTSDDATVKLYVPDPSLSFLLIS